MESFHKQIKQVFTNNTCGNVSQLLKCLTTKLVNYYSVEGAEFKYYREPDSPMNKKAKELEVKSLLLIMLTLTFIFTISLVLTFNISFQYFKI